MFRYPPQRVAVRRPVGTAPPVDGRLNAPTGDRAGLRHSAAAVTGPGRSADRPAKIPHAMSASPGPGDRTGEVRTRATFASGSRDESLRVTVAVLECPSSVTLEAGGTGARTALDVLENLVLVPPNRARPDSDWPGEPTRLYSFVNRRARKPGDRLHLTPLQQFHAYLLVARRAIWRGLQGRGRCKGQESGQTLENTGKIEGMGCAQQDRGRTFRPPKACASSAATGPAMWRSSPLAA